MKYLKYFFFSSILCSLVIFSDCNDKVDESSESLIYLSENGITIKAYENAVVGESYSLNGINYLVVDSAMLYQMVDENADVSKVVTTKIARMLYLFSDSTDQTFNQDISSWDVSNVTECSAFRFNATSWTKPKPNFTNCTE